MNIATLVLAGTLALVSIGIGVMAGWLHDLERRVERLEEEEEPCANA